MPFIEIERTTRRKIFVADGDPIKAKVPKGFTVITIDKRTFLGWCEACGKPICDEDKFGADEDGTCFVCHDCYHKTRQA